MNVQAYLEQFPNTPYINLIGPFYNGVYLDQEPVVFVDGGAQARQGNIGFAVGDGDSTSKVLDEYLPTQKDHSDLSYVLQNTPDQFEVINLLGFLGGRRDHEIINICEAYTHIASAQKPKRIVFDYDIVVYSSGQWSLSIEGLFSLISFYPNQLTIRGKCKYQLTDPTEFRELSSQGLSNEGYGEMTIECSQPIVVFLNASEQT